MMASAGRGAGLAGFAVLAADGAAGLGFERGQVEEGERGRGGDDLDDPAALLGELDELACFGGGACAAHDVGQDAGGLVHRRTPSWRPKASAWRWMLGGAVVIRSLIRRRVLGRPVISSWAICSAARSAR
jgi:hypothetical protein